MVHDREAVGTIAVRESMQPLVVLLGTSLQFSDQLVRVLGFEFPDVRFHRLSDPDAICEIEGRPTLVLLHESMPNIVGRIQHLKRSLQGSVLAVACADATAFRRGHPPRSLPPVSLLQMNAPIDVWLSVFRLLLCGHVYIPAEVLADWREDERAAVAEPAGPAPRRAATVAPDTPLTPREMQILPLIAEGKQNKTIAGELGLSEHTVKLHTHNIFTKLKVSNRTGAANWYLSQVDPLGCGLDVHAK